MERIYAKSIRDIFVGDYKVKHKIGSGSFGDIYLGISRHNGERVAIKVESSLVKHPQLEYEYRLYRALRSGPGLPRVRSLSKESNYTAMVMQLLGPSLEKLFDYCSRVFSVKTVLQLADQLLQRAEFIHTRGFVHRDIKPENLLIGLNGQCKRIFLVDFGLAKKFQDVTSGVHIPYREDCNLTGTARYSSIWAQMGREQSRRDDLASIGYVLVYFLRNGLPWQGLKASTKRQKYERILEVKTSISNEQLCEGLPVAFVVYLNAVFAMDFYEKPDYNKMRKVFYSCRLSMRCPRTDFFDWNLLQNVTLHDQPNLGVGIRTLLNKQHHDDGSSGCPVVHNEKCNRWD